MQYTGLEDLFALMPMLAGLADGGFGGGDLGGLLGGEGLSGDAISDFLEAGLGGDLSADMIQGLLGGAGGDFDIGGNAAILQMIQDQLGGQLGEEELKMLMDAIGQGGLGGGGGGGAGPRRGGGERPGRAPGGDRRGVGDERGRRDIGDVNRERQERNDKWRDP